MGYCSRGLAFVAGLIFFLLPNGAFSQDDDQNRIVDLLIKVELDISLDDGNIVMDKTLTEHRQYNSSFASTFAERSISYGFWSEITDVEAYSLVPKGDNGKFKKLKVKDFSHRDERTKGIFINDERSMNFRFEGLTAGAQSYLHYQANLKNEHFATLYYFQRSFLVKQMDFIVRIDPEIELFIKEYHTEGVGIEYSKTEEKGQIVHRWSRENVKGQKSFSNEPDISFFEPHIIVFVKSYMANGQKHNVLSSVDDLFNHYKDLVDRTDRENAELLAEIATEVTDGLDSEREKVQALYYWVRNNIKYIADEAGLGGFIPRSATTVCDNRYGDCKDMAHLLHQLAIHANCNVKLAWIGTRDRPYKYDELPSPMVDNHMIAAWKDGDDWLFLDCTGKETEFGFPTAFIQGKEALIWVDDDAFEVAEVPVVPADRNKIYDKISISIEDGVIRGENYSEFSGYYKANFNSTHSYMSREEKEDFYQSYFSKCSNKAEIIDVQITDSEVMHDPLEIRYKFDVDDYVIETDDEIIFNMNLNKPYLSSRLEDNRTTPREFNFNSHIVTVVDLQLPEGYGIQYLPENAHFDSDSFTADLTYVQSGDLIRYTQNFKLKDLILTEDEFTEWNLMVDALARSYKSAIVLHKIEAHTDE